MNSTLEELGDGILAALILLAFLFSGCTSETSTGPKEEPVKYTECGFTKDGKRDSCWTTTAARRTDAP